jgi:hypothetical protein
VVLGVFVAGDDLVVADFPVQGTGLLVLDTAMALGVELIEMDVAAAGAGSAISLDGNANEAELKAAFPRGTCSHGKKLLETPPCGIVPEKEGGCRRDAKIPVIRQPSWG